MTNDYIRRKDAIEVINQGRLTKLIDADVAESGLKNIPAADVVQVVRCGKCRYCTNNWHSSVYDLCKITGRNVIDTDFCNYGERREDY